MTRSRIILRFRTHFRNLCTTAGCAVLAMAGMFPAAAQAQPSSFPSKPIRFIVPFPPGSGSDISARFFAAQISPLAKQTVVVENRPGGNGFIAVNAVLSAPADGHTVLIGATSLFTTNLVTFKTLPYDPIKDFAPVSMLMRAPSVAVVAMDSPIDTLETLVERAREEPGKINSGTGAASYQLAAAAFYQRAQVKLTNIPFKGASEAVAAAVSNVVDVAVVDIGSALPLIRGGKLRALAISSEARNADLPDVPTYVESGYPGYTTFNWSGAAVSSKTPPAIVAQLGKWFDEVASRAETRDALKQFLSEPVPGGPAEMKRQQISEIERWRGIAAFAGVQPQ